LLGDNLDKLHQVVSLLLERETIDGSDLAAIVGLPDRPPVIDGVLIPRAVAMSPSNGHANGSAITTSESGPTTTPGLPDLG
jgi:hypothetical protein